MNDAVDALHIGLLDCGFDSLPVQSVFWGKKLPVKKQKKKPETQANGQSIKISASKIKQYVHLRNLYTFFSLAEIWINEALNINRIWSQQ